jgi:small conductance mechanosensitive channel
VLELGGSCIRLAVRPWVDNSDYWVAFFDLQELIKNHFDAAGIKVPLLQREVHLHQEKTARPAKPVS